uniref:Secreted protein n=1 Tax=Anopheles melas TaxID=34690 RepID=A0A182U5M9_9DIPT
MNSKSPSPYLLLSSFFLASTAYEPIVASTRNTVKLLPKPVRLSDRLGGECGILCVAVERELILRLAVRDLVDLEPLDRGAQQPGEHRLHVADIVHLIGQRVVHVDRDNLPVRFALVDQRDRAEYFHLQHLAPLRNARANLEHIDGIVIALAAGVRVQVVRVLPGLRERTVVPDVAVVREAVGDEPQLALLHVLLDRVQALAQADFHLGVCPAGHLHHHVVHGSLIVRVQWNVMQR